MRRLTFWLRYLSGNVPWDTDITPPEIRQLIEEENLPPGRAIDLGCGTGTNAIYLAQHGWQAVGIDYIARPIRLARRKAQQAGVAHQTRFIVGDVTGLDTMELGEDFDLAVDIGCGHSLSEARQLAYARCLGQLLRPGGILMLYMFRPTPEHSFGLEPEAVRRLFEADFRLIWSDLGQDVSAQAGSAWYRFVRNGRSSEEADRL
jgi:SAM-dependent methyltransferase